MVRSYTAVVSILILFGCSTKEKEVLKTPGHEIVFGSPNNEVCSGGVFSDNFIFISGSTDPLLPEHGDFLLMKVDRLGQEVWRKTFGDPVRTEESTGVKALSDGSLLVYGKSATPGGLSDGKLIKVNEAGTLLWSSTFGGFHNDFVWDAIELSNGNIMATGVTQSFGAGALDQYVVLMDRGGRILREITFGGTDVDAGSRLVQLPSGNVMIYGHTRSFGALDRDLLLTKLNDNGDSLWSKVIYDPDYQESQGFIMSKDGGLLYSAHSASLDPAHNMLIRKTDTLGNVIWEDQIGGVAHDGGEDVVELINGDILFMGRSNSFGGTDQDIMVNVTNASGITKDFATYGGGGEDHGEKVLTDGGYFYILGHTDLLGNGVTDLYFIKVSI